MSAFTHTATVDIAVGAGHDAKAVAHEKATKGVFGIMSRTVAERQRCSPRHQAFEMGVLDRYIIASGGNQRVRIAAEVRTKLREQGQAARALGRRTQAGGGRAFDPTKASGRAAATSPNQ